MSLHFHATCKCKLLRKRLRFEILPKQSKQCQSKAPLYTPRPRTALLMCLKKYSAIGNSAIGNYVVLYSKPTLKTVLLEVSYGKND